MGIVEEVGRDVKKLKRGDRVVIPFTIACGNCFFCKDNLWSLCDNSNPNAHVAEEMYGYSGSALFGFSHIYGGYAGGQAQFARVPFADVGPIKIENDLPDESVLFLSDIYPTGFMGAQNCNISPGDNVAVWGCGPVGLFAIASAYMLGAGKVFAIDRFPERLALARQVRGNDDQLQRRRCDRGRGAARPDGRDRAGLLHRCGRDGGALLDGGGDVRQGEAGADAGDGSAVCAAAGVPGDSQGRHAVDSGGVWRGAGQAELWRGVRQGNSHGNGADPHAQLPAAAAEVDREQEDRSNVYDFARYWNQPGAGVLQTVDGEGAGGDEDCDRPVAGHDRKSCRSGDATVVELPWPRKGSAQAAGPFSCALRRVRVRRRLGCSGHEEEQGED